MGSIGIGVIIKIVWSLFSWWMGDKADRAKRAKEIADLFIQVQKDGDSLAKQVHIEMSQSSEVDWGEIPIRPSAINKTHPQRSPTKKTASRKTVRVPKRKSGHRD